MAMARVRRIGLVSAIAAALVVVFAWYLQPDMVVALATRLWNCF